VPNVNSKHKVETVQPDPQNARKRLVANLQQAGDKKAKTKAISASLRPQPNTTSAAKAITKK
jgi:hypothetical protein